MSEITHLSMNDEGCQLQLPYQTRLRTTTDLNALSCVLSWFDQLNHPIIPQSVWLQCQLALAEGFTNAVRHAHRDKPTDTVIDIETILSEQSLEIRIWDCGQGFDLVATLKQMPPQIDQNAEGGRGLRLIQKIADVFTYTRMGDRRNCLLIIKNYAKSP